MAERIAITEITQLGIETTPGTPVTATKKLQAISIAPAIKVDVTSFRPLGGKFATLAALGKDWTEAEISGIASYSDLTYIFASLLSYGAPQQQGTTPAYKWTFTPSQNSADTIKTYTVESGSSVRAGRFSYGIVTEFGLEISRDSAEVSGTMLGQKYEDNITLSSTTAVEPVPILPTQVDVYMDNSAANIGTTKLTRVLSASFDISDRFGPLWVLNSAASGYVAHVETVPTVTLKLLMEADSTGMEPLTALRGSAKRFLRIKATGPLIQNPYNYEFVLDMCGLVTDVSDFSDEDGVYAIEWTFTATYDANWGKALTVSLTNTLSAL
jgi:hypothetical protein